MLESDVFNAGSLDRSASRGIFLARSKPGLPPVNGLVGRFVASLRDNALDRPPEAGQADLVVVPVGSIFSPGARWTGLSIFDMTFLPL